MFPNMVMVVSNDMAMCDSLRALLPVILREARIEFAAGLAESFIRLNTFNPHVLLIDTGIGQNEIADIIDDVEVRHSGVRIVLLADAPTWQSWRLYRTTNTVLLKGFSIRQLAAAIQPNESAG